MMRSKAVLRVLLAALGFAAGAALAAVDPATVRRASELRSAPYRDAPAVAALATGDKVNIVRRQGGWYNVTSAKGTGWVRMLEVRRSRSRAASLDPESLLALSSGRVGTGQVAATTGIRGLGEAELEAAKFDAAELARLESYAVTEREARVFAVRGRLPVHGAR